MGEQKDEDEHKLWCDVETEKSTESKDEKTAKKIVENNDKVNAITEYQTEETGLRDENHKEILATIKDSQDAKAAITDAIRVLKDFYQESGMVAKEPWEFIQ